MAKLYFHYAAMNAGKSTTLLQASFNYRERGMRTALFTAAIDTRAAKGQISSRIGITETAYCFDEGTDFVAMISSLIETKPIDCIFVDEAQFLSSRHVDQLANVVDHMRIPVMCFGLRTDFRGELFQGSARLLALADEIRELKTICHCGKKAIMNLRIDADGDAITIGDRIEVGGNERYTALCRKHFHEAFKRPSEKRRA